MDANFAIRPIVLQLEVDQDGVTEFYVGAHFAFGPFLWHSEVAQGVTEFYMDAQFAIGPIDW
jgi:hypothetical protein